MDMPDMNDPEVQRMLDEAQKDPQIRAQALHLVDTQQEMIRYYLGRYEDEEKEQTSVPPTQEQVMILRALSLPQFVAARDVLITKGVISVLSMMIGDLENAKRELQQ